MGLEWNDKIWAVAVNAIPTGGDGWLRAPQARIEDRVGTWQPHYT